MAGLMGVYNSGTDPGSKWYFEPATVTIAQPTITFDNTTNTVTMTCATTDATIYYTLMAVNLLLHRHHIPLEVLYKTHQLPLGLLLYLTEFLPL